MALNKHHTNSEIDINLTVFDQSSPGHIKIFLMIKTRICRSKLYMQIKEVQLEPNIQIYPTLTQKI